MALAVSVSVAHMLVSVLLLAWFGCVLSVNTPSIRAMRCWYEEGLLFGFHSRVLLMPAGKHSRKMFIRRQL